MRYFTGCFILCGLFLFSCSREPDLHSVMSENEPRHIDVRDENGQTIARLQEGEQRDTLWLTLFNEDPILFGECEDQVVQTTALSESGLTAVVYVRNCGASTDWATRVDLVASVERAGKDDRNTIYIVKGSQPVSVTREDNQKVIIYFPPMSPKHIYRQQEQLGEIQFDYKETSSSFEETQYLEFANFNFGLTGIGAGVPEEVLLRMAGWAQEKSGLIRSEWSNWFGSPPYGDDPREHELIKEGIIYYYQNRDEITKQKQ